MHDDDVDILIDLHTQSRGVRVPAVLVSSTRIYAARGISFVIFLVRHTLCLGAEAMVARVGTLI